MESAYVGQFFDQVIRNGVLKNAENPAELGRASHTVRFVASGGFNGKECCLYQSPSCQL